MNDVLANKLVSIAGRCSIESDRQTIIEATTALRASAPSSKQPAWPKEEIGLGQFADVDPAVLGPAMVLDIEEKYLLGHFDEHCACDIMPGDVQGSFHRIREALAGHQPSTATSAERYLTPEEDTILRQALLGSSTLAYEITTPPSSGNADAVRAALIKIAFDAEVNGLAGNPKKWPSTIAYLALGGRISEGVHLDTEESLAALSSAPVAGEWKEETLWRRLDLGDGHHGYDQVVAFVPRNDRGEVQS